MEIHKTLSSFRTVLKKKIIDIWNSESYMHIRELIRDGRENISICSKRDTILFYTK